jgi:hypothetical protein
LGSGHLPFGFITKPTLEHLNEHKVLILANVNMMDDAEIETIRKWVHAGGKLLATGWTSLVNTRGKLRKDFGLSDVLGVSIQKPRWDSWPHYIAPSDEGAGVFGEFGGKYPAFARTTGQHVALRPASNAIVLATTTLVWPTDDPTRFASIHSNPPWQKTERPEVVFHRFGAGTCIYCASPLETVESLSGTIVRLVRRLHDHFCFEADAPAAVELTLFQQADRHRYRLSLVNFQKDLPNIPATDIPIRLRLPERVVQVVELPGGRGIEHAEANGVVKFTVPRLETLAMFGVIVA